MADAPYRNDGEKDRRPSTHRLVAAGEVRKTLALDDGAAAHFVGRELVRVISARPGARGYEVRRRGSRAVETVLQTHRLTRTGGLSRRPR